MIDAIGGEILGEALGTLAIGGSLTTLGPCSATPSARERRQNLANRPRVSASNATPERCRSKHRTRRTSHATCIRAGTVLSMQNKR